MNITELTEASTITLENVATSATAYKVVANNNTDRYFTFETRVQEGWDALLPAEGLLIIRVDYDEDAWDLQNNSVNTTVKRQRFQFVPADNDISVETFEGDLWPNGGQTSFTESTSPNMKIHLTTIKGKPVTNIAFDTESKVASFDFMGGTGSVEGVLDGESQAYYNGTDIVIRNSQATEAYVYNVQGMLVATVKVVNGEAYYRPAGRGLYVVRCGELCEKVNAQ
jgi:hypothetical protein